MRSSRSAATVRRRSGAIEQHTPDLVFLDVQMPGLNGFEVIEAVGAREDAARHLRDGLRSARAARVPGPRPRLPAEALRPRALQGGAAARPRPTFSATRPAISGRRLLALVKDLRRDQPKTDRLVVKSGGRLFFLRTDEIDWIEAAGNYVRLHVGPASHLLRETMNAIEGRLDPEKFFRIHRSRIVNMERIQEMQPWLNGEYAVAAADRNPPDAQPRLPGKAPGAPRPDDRLKLVRLRPLTNL